MSSLDGFFDGLYSKFLLRDILGRAIPGFIALLAIADFLKMRPPHLPNRDLGLLYYVMVYGVSFASGTLLQYLGWRASVVKVQVWPKTGLFKLAEKSSPIFLRHPRTIQK